MRSFSLEASGRTTLVYHIMAEAQPRGGICAFIDAEHAMDPQYARRIGVDIDQLLVSQPDTGEQALVLVVVELLVGNVPPGMILRFAVRTEDDRDRPLVFLFPSEGLSS